MCSTGFFYWENAGNATQKTTCLCFFPILSFGVTCIWLCSRRGKVMGQKQEKTCKVSRRSECSASPASPSYSSCPWPPVSILSPPPSSAKIFLCLNVHFKAWSFYALIIFSGGCYFFPKCLCPGFVWLQNNLKSESGGGGIQSLAAQV